MLWVSILFVLFLFDWSQAVRLHKLFQFIDGFKSEHHLRGFLHLGYDYAVFLRKPKPHDRYLIYELYESRKVAEERSSKPRVLAISKVPIDFMKEQLKIYRDELYKAKYFDENVVPGTRVKTLREWQIEKALALRHHDHMVPLSNDAPILRTKLD